MFTIRKNNLFIFLFFISAFLIIIPVSCNDDSDSTTFRPARQRRINLRLFPEPDGPYYGQIDDTKTALRRQLYARSAAGTCEEGASYEIRSPNDFRQHLFELQCIFASGLTPSKVPAGPYYTGTLVNFNSNNILLNTIINIAWEGNAAFKIKCFNNSDTETYIGIHNLLGRVALPFTLCVRNITENLAPGEYEDGKQSVVIDVPEDFSDECPNFGEYVANNQNKLPIRTKFIESVYPVTNVFAGIRLVGRQEDGGAIYLARAYMKDNYRRDKQAATLGFWYFVNYDEEVNPEFGIGDSLPPLRESFRYTFPGLTSFFQRISPVDNLITRPLSTVSKFTIVALNSGRAYLVNFRELMRNFGSIRMNTRRLRNYYSTRNI